MKKQNKEQVPPPAVEPKKSGNKKQTKKVVTVTNHNQKQGRFRSLEEALKAVSVPRLQVGKEEDSSQAGRVAERRVEFGALLVERRYSGKNGNSQGINIYA